MKRLFAWILTSAVFIPQAYSAEDHDWEQWETTYHNALQTSDSKALSMLQDRYSALPPSVEKLYISSKLHNFMTLRGQPYYGNSIAFDEEYSNLEQSFMAGLNAEAKLDFATATKSYLTNLEHANSKGNIQGQILFEYHLCRALNAQGQFYSALVYCNALETHLSEVDHTILPKYDALRVVGNNQEFVGRYQAALDTYQAYLNSIPSYVDPSGVYNDAGLLLKTLGQYDLAIDYMNHALSIREKSNMALGMAQSHHSMGDILLATQDYLGAIQHFSSSKQILNDYNYSYGVTHVALGLGKAYAQIQQYRLSYQHLSEALSLAETQGNDSVRGEIYLALSVLAKAQDDFDGAQDYSQQAHALAGKIQSERLQAKALKSLATIAQDVGQYKLALQYHQQYFDSEIAKRTKKNRAAFLAMERAQQEFNQTIKQNQKIETIKSLENEIHELEQQRRFFMLGIVLLSLVLITQYLISRTKSKKAEIDQLSGAFNRAASIHKIRSVDRTPSLIKKHILVLLDLDDFKQVNDSYGHPTGDRALQAIAKCIQTTLHEGDIFGRLGGEEFVAVMKNVDELDVRERVEELHQRIGSSEFTAETKEKLTITASLSYLATSKPLSDFDELYSILDQALYQVKMNGKNQIIDAYNEPIYLPNSAYVPVQP